MIRTKTVQMIDVQDWDQLVVDTYGKPYSFQQQDGCKERQTFEFSVPYEAYDCGNNAIPEDVNGEEMGVSFAAWLARDPKQELDSLDEWDRKHGIALFWERNFYPDMQMIANDLHAKGLLPAGDYTIDIDW
jgi:hypothetical protein